MTPGRLLLSLPLLMLAVACQRVVPPPDNSTEQPKSRLSVPQELYAEVNGVRLHYLDWGGTGDLMLFLPGLTQTAHTYAEVAPAFTSTFRVVALTHRGHGASEKPDGPYDGATLVDDVTAFVDAVGGRRVVLVAHSFSGVLLPDIVRRLGERVVRALVLLDAVYDWPTVWDQPWPGPAQPDSIYDSHDALDTWWREHYPATWGPTFRLMLRGQTYLGADGRLHNQLRDDDFKRFVDIAALGCSFDGLRVPMLVVISDDSTVEYGVPAPEAEAMRAWSRDFHVPNKRRSIEVLLRAVPDATVLEIEGPHAAYLFAPVRIVQMMQDYLALI